jgi:hypothetical protein
MSKITHYPAYGKRLMLTRLDGEVPNNSVVVSFDRDIGKLFPRIVIYEDISADAIELRYLAGLDVIIAYHDEHASRVLGLARAILKVKPRILQAFAIDIPTTLILKHSNGKEMI